MSLGRTPRLSKIVRRYMHCTSSSFHCTLRVQRVARLAVNYQSTLNQCSPLNCFANSSSCEVELSRLLVWAVYRYIRAGALHLSSSAAKRPHVAIGAAAGESRSNFHPFETSPELLRVQQLCSCLRYAHESVYEDVSFFFHRKTLSSSSIYRKMCRRVTAAVQKADITRRRSRSPGSSIRQACRNITEKSIYVARRRKRKRRFPAAAELEAFRRSSAWAKVGIQINLAGSCALFSLSLSTFRSCNIQRNTSDAS